MDIELCLLKFALRLTREDSSATQDNAPVDQADRDSEAKESCKRRTRPGIAHVHE